MLSAKLIKFGLLFCFCVLMNLLKYIKHILLFNIMALRDYNTFLKILLSDNKIDLVLLCPIITSINNPQPGNEIDN